MWRAQLPVDVCLIQQLALTQPGQAAAAAAGRRRLCVVVFGGRSCTPHVGTISSWPPLVALRVQPRQHAVAVQVLRVLAMMQAYAGSVGGTANTRTASARSLVRPLSHTTSASDARGTPPARPPPQPAPMPDLLPLVCADGPAGAAAAHGCAGVCVQAAWPIHRRVQRAVAVPAGARVSCSCLLLECRTE
jgi:hypothetical protein